jgi:hypothetical protein
MVSFVAAVLPVALFLISGHDAFVSPALSVVSVGRESWNSPTSRQQSFRCVFDRPQRTSLSRRSSHRLQAMIGSDGRNVVDEEYTRNNNNRRDAVTTPSQVGNSAARRNPNDNLPHPHPELSAIDVVTTCMNLFLLKGQEQVGLEVCFNFSSEKCRAAIGGSLSEFALYAQNPTFAYLTKHCRAWRILAVGPVIAGTNHRGAMQTVLIEVASVDPLEQTATSSTTLPESAKVSPLLFPNKARAAAAAAAAAAASNRKFLWTLQQERRPPLQGCWMIHEVLYTKNAWQQTL